MFVTLDGIFIKMIFVEYLLVRIPVMPDHTTKSVSSSFGPADITLIEFDVHLFQIAKLPEYRIDPEESFLIVQRSHVAAHHIVVVRLCSVLNIIIVLGNEPVILLHYVVVA